ncbi:MAG: glycosyltransferase family 39 protein [Devosia sp.]|nr:glycosyltransferase family 39 protein [Devosia sp.]
MKNLTIARAAELAPVAVLKWAALLLVLFKLAVLIGGGIFQDEAYYWMWGQHPALSYFDHPPLTAWLQGLAGAVFGWNRLALRIMVALALAGDLAVLWLMARKLVPGASEQHFWLTSVLFLSTPMFFAVTAAALPDHLLVLGILSASYFLGSFVIDRERSGAGRYRDLYLGALCLGLAGLAKYNAAFLGVGFGLFLMLSPPHRALLRKWQLYLAAGIALAVQAPVLIWNLQHEWASFGFISGGRFAGDVPTSGIGWLLGAVLFLSPFMLVAMGRFLLARAASPAEALARVVFLLSTLAIIGVSLATPTIFHWNLVAYLAVLPFLALHFRRRWLYWAQVLYGFAFAGFVLVNYAIMPLTDVAAIRDEASAWAYGWEETSATVEAARAAHGAGFIATPDYTTAALLGYAMRDPKVTSLSAKTDQFDFWFDAATHAGEDAILFGDDWRPLTSEVTSRFESVTLLEEIPVSRLGKPLDTHRIYLGRGFLPGT